MTLLRNTILITLIGVFITSCTSTQRQEGFSPDGEEGAVITPRRDTSPAVLELLNKARNASQSGQLHRAEALLERAIRIEPKNPVLWHYMAKVHLFRGRLEQAEGLAAKSNSLAGNDSVLKSDNWRIIAHARQARGDQKGARDAQRRASAEAGGS